MANTATWTAPSGGCYVVNIVWSASGTQGTYYVDLTCGSTTLLNNEAIQIDSGGQYMTTTSAGVTLSAGQTIELGVNGADVAIPSVTYYGNFTYYSGGTINVESATALTSTQVEYYVKNQATFTPTTNLTKTINETVTTLNVGSSAVYTVTGSNGYDSKTVSVTINCVKPSVSISLNSSYTTNYNYGTSSEVIKGQIVSSVYPDTAIVYLIKYNGASYSSVTSLTSNGTYGILGTATNYTNGFSSQFTLKVIPVIVNPGTLEVQPGSTLATVFDLITINKDSSVTLPTHTWTLNGVSVSESTVLTTPADYTATLSVTDSEGLTSSTVSFTITVNNAVIDPTITRGFPYLTTYFKSAYIQGATALTSEVMAGADVSSIGNSLKIDYEFPSSVVAGYSVSTNVSSNTTYYSPVGINYGDRYGMFSAFKFKFGRFLEKCEYTTANYKARTLPACTTADFEDSSGNSTFIIESPALTYAKDGGNTHALTYQLSFIADELESSKIILGYHFIEKMLNFSVSNATSDNERRLYMSIYDTYSKFDNLVPKGEQYANATITVEIDSSNRYVKITLGGSFTDNASACKSWAICDGNDNLLIAYNMVNPYDSTDIDRSGILYFNFVHTRG